MQHVFTVGLYCFTDVLNALVGRQETYNITAVYAPMHGGEYTCFVSNEAGVGLHSSILNIPVEFVEVPASELTTAGSDVTLTCSAEAYPSHTIQWQKMNRADGQFEDITNENENSLSFSTIGYDDFGTYRCSASNTIDGEDYKETTTHAVITVSPQGSLSLSPDNETFADSAEVNLTCTIQGGPNNQFEWYFNGQIVVSGTNRINISTFESMSTLRISSISAPLHGGAFTCRASNEAGHDENTTIVFVSPIIKQGPSAVTLKENGDNAVLQCVAEAFPLPQYFWVDTLNNSEVTVDGQFLEFQPVTFGDESIYKCRVRSNGLVAESTQAYLHGRSC